MVPREEPPLLRLYTRPGCGLCHELEQALAPAVARGRIRIELVDIHGNQELEEAYGSCIPVLAWRGRVLAKGRINPEEALARLERWRAREEAGA